jgi:DNA-binding response OmpR family regulator
MRVLIVEDEFLVAMLLEDMLSDMGYQVMATARVDEALKLACDADVGFAILDVNLKGVKSFPVAAVLRGRGIPFVFTTGYGPAGLTSEFKDELTLQKPYEPRELKRAIAEVFARTGG